MENGLNILVLTAEYPPLTGGAGSFIFDLVNGLEEYPCRITVITRGSTSSDLSLSDNLRIIRVKSFPKLFLCLMWLQVKKIYNRKTDLIVVNDVGAAMIAALGFNREMQNKTVCMLHGQEPEDVFVRNRYWLLGFKKRYQNLLKCCRVIVAVSKSMREKFIQISNNPALADKTSIVYNSINTSTFNHVNSDLKQRLNISDRCKIFITVARLVKDKGLDTVMHVLEKYRQQQGDDFIWLIIGSGEYEPEFQQKIKRSPVQNQIKMVGAIPRGELRYYYSIADVFILLSNFKESFGLVYLEASACGCPVIGLDRGGVNEAVENGINGYLIPNDESLILENSITAINDIIAGRIDRTTCRNYANKFTINTNSKVFWNLIKRQYVSI